MYSRAVTNGFFMKGMLKKVLCAGLLVVGVGLFVGCPSPAGSNPPATAVTGNAIIQSLTMNNISPTSTTSYERAVVNNPNLADATAAMATAFQRSQNVPQMVVTLLKNYIGSQSLAIGSTNSFGAASTISTGGTGDMATFDVGASQIKIVATDSDAQIYWSSIFTITIMSVPTDYSVQLKLALEDFATPGDPTSYRLATVWMNMLSGVVAVNQIKAINNLATGSYSKFSPWLTGSDFGGEIDSSGKSGSGVYRCNISWGKNFGGADTDTYAYILEAFGNGNGVIISTIGDTLHSGVPDQTATYGDDTGLAAALSASPAGLTLTIPGDNNLESVASANLGWNAAFGASGTFETELGVASYWF